MLNSDNAFCTVNEEQEAPAVGPQHHSEQVISHVVLTNQLQWSCLSTAASRQPESADLGECIIANVLTEPGSVPICRPVYECFPLHGRKTHISRKWIS